MYANEGTIRINHVNNNDIVTMNSPSGNVESDPDPNEIIINRVVSDEEVPMFVPGSEAV